MNEEQIQKWFDDAQSNHISFIGFCHDCKEPVEVKMDINDETGECTIEDGAIYNPIIGGIGERQKFLKCDKCYEKNKILTNWQPTELYSRVVGYLRPIKQWNKGKQAEFIKRKEFANIEV
jgi:hypothetical protein